jgi:hypothetical protein
MNAGRMLALVLAVAALGCQAARPPHAHWPQATYESPPSQSNSAAPAAQAEVVDEDVMRQAHELDRQFETESNELNGLENSAPRSDK